MTTFSDDRPGRCWRGRSGSLESAGGVAVCLHDNSASQLVLEMLGFQRVGMEGVLLVWEQNAVPGVSRVLSSQGMPVRHV